MHAELNYLRSHLNNNKFAHNFDLNNNKFAHNFEFLYLQRRLPVKNFVVAHENERLSIRIYGILHEL